MRKEFTEQYIARYGHGMQAVKPEIVSLHVAAFARTPRPSLEQVVRQPEGGAAVARSRPVYFAEEGRQVDTAVYSRAALPVGFSAAGPAVIEEYGSTTVVGPDDRFGVGSLGEIRIDVAPARRKAA